MRRVEALLVLAVGLSVAWGAGPASARAQGNSAQGAMPPGHPPVDGEVVPAGPIVSDIGNDEDTDEPLPPGHPVATPGKQGGAASGTFTPPPDTEAEEASLPAGSIAVELRDPANQVLPDTELTLGILHQSVAKGESREHKVTSTDAGGNARFDGLETGGGIAYRLTVPKDGATFAALPFQLPSQRGMRVVLHVYPVTREIQEALVVMQGVLFIEVKDDRVQLEEAFTVFNLGKVAWLADGVLLRLPPSFTALSAQQTMSDQGVDSQEKEGARLHGTFAPGRHEVQFKWQLPYSGESLVDFSTGLPPHVAVLRVIAGASHGAKLHVVGFPDAERRTDAQGQKLLVTEKQVRRDEPLSAVHVTLDGLPTPGAGRILATGLAAFLVVAGVSLARGGAYRQASSDKARRSVLLAELADLERGRETAEVGPKTYERNRRELIDDIARTLGPTSDTD